jgi:predicted helicase
MTQPTSTDSTNLTNHIDRYTKYIYEDLSNLDITTATYKDHLHKSFEWFSCIQLSLKYNSIFIRWEDVSPNLREEKGMRRDMGIDSWDITGNRVAQMKCYNGNISFSNLSTFLACCLKFYSSQKILYRTHESTVCSMIKSFISDNILTDITIPDIDFRTECKRIQSLSFQYQDTIEPFVMRHYQSESISLLEQGKIENKNVYLCIPTGCGKTAIILHYHLNHQSEKLLVLVPLVNLMYQWADECKNIGIKPYLIGTGKKS